MSGKYRGRRTAGFVTTLAIAKLILAQLACSPATDPLGDAISTTLKNTVGYDCVTPFSKAKFENRGFCRGTWSALEVGPLCGTDGNFYETECQMHLDGEVGTCRALVRVEECRSDGEAEQ